QAKKKKYPIPEIKTLENTNTNYTKEDPNKKKIRKKYYIQKILTLTALLVNVINLNSIKYKHFIIINFFF
ncbi:MAG: hypothetical protein IJI98_00695, partial [Methanosphaera sp.]|nr:hypothetical protein [Methanosphaera sp.]